MKLPKIILITLLILIVGSLTSYSIYTYAVPYDKHDFVQHIETKCGLVNCYSIYQINKPIEITEEKLDNFGFEFIKLSGDLKSWKIEVEKEQTYQEVINHYKENCIPVYEEFANGSILDTQECTRTFDYAEQVEETRKVWKEINKQQIINAVLNAPVGKSWNIKVSGKRKPCEGGGFDCRFEVDNILSFAGYRFDEYVWWNSSYAYKRDIFNETVSDVAVAVNGTSGFCGNVIWTNAKHGDLEFYYNNCSDFAVANSTDEVYHEVQNKSYGFQSRDVYRDTSLTAIYHFDYATDYGFDSLGIYNASLTGFNTNNTVNANATTKPYGSYATVYQEGQHIDVGFNDADTISICAWVAPSTQADTEYNFLISNTNTQFMIGLDDAGAEFGVDGKYNCYIYDPAIYNTVNSTTSYSTDGTWQHVCCVADATNSLMHIYVNGLLEDSSLYRSLQTHSAFHIGGKGSGSNNMLGSIDEVRFYNNTVLSAQEVLDLYNQTANNFGAEETANTPPEVTTVTIEPTIAYGNTLIHCNTTTYDAQAGDVLTVNMTWWNGTTYYSKHTNSTARTGQTLNFTLGGTPQAYGETWNCSVIINDGTVDSALNSTTITISNNLPTQGTPLLNSSNSALNDTNQNLTCYNVSTTDPDGDYVKNIYNWYVYNYNIFVVNMPFEANGSESSVAKDYSSRGNDGTVSSAVFLPTGGIDGLGAYNFAGASDYIQIADDSTLDFNLTSIGLWIKTSNADEVIMEKWETTGDERSWKLELNVAGLLTWSIDPIGNGASVSSIAGNSNLADGAWHHIIAIRNSTSIGIFVDGLLQQAESQNAGIHYGTADLYLGGISGSANFSGIMDEVMIVNSKGICANQALAWYNNQTNLIHSDETTAGEVWQCGISINDGIDDGVAKNSSSLTILSYAPNIANLTIDPLTSYTNTSIFGKFVVTDLDDDPVDVTCYWYNGTTEFQRNTSSYAVNTQQSVTLTPSVQHKRETWNFTCNATDGILVSGQNSTIITINNTKPSNAQIGDPTNASRQTGNSVILNCDSSTDIDGDTVYYEIYGDADTNPPTTLLQNTTIATYTWATTDGKTYWWRCRAGDEEETSEYSTIKQFVENNQSLLTNIKIEPSTAYTNSTLNGSIVVYDSEDTLSVNMTWWNGTTYYSKHTKTGVSSGSTVNFTLTPQVQHEGETWNFSVITYDGYEYSEMNSTTITISNHIPSIDTPTLSPTNVYTNTSLFNCSTTAYDIDVPETLTVNITWYNGTVAYSSTVISTSNGTLVSFQLLPDLIQHKRETWNCSVRAYDGTSYSELNPSTTKTILNTVPSTPTQNTPLNYSVITGTSTTLNCSGSQDIDNDTLYYEFYGDEGGASPATLLQNSTSQTYTWSSLIPDTYYWRCKVNDQEGSSPYTLTWVFANIEGGMQVNETCGTGYTEIMYYNFGEENNLTTVTNATIDYNLKFSIGGTGNETINGSLVDIDYFSVCANISITDSYEVVYGEIEYRKTGFTTRRYYLFSGTRLATPKVDDTLFFLPNTDATSFLFEFKSTALVPYENHYATLLRWYPELDTYDTVDMGKTDNKGQTIMRVLTEDADYRIGVYESNGTLVKLLDPIRFACLSSPCSYSALVEAVAIDYTSIYGIASNLIWEVDTFRFTYNDPSQKTSQMELKVYKDTGISSIEICSDTATGYTGIINCNVSAYTGTLRAVAYRTASPALIIAQKIIQTTTTVFKGTVGLFVSFIIFLVLIFIGGAISPVLAVFFGIVALVPAVALGSITLAIFIGIGVLGGIVIHFMKRVG